MKINFENNNPNNLNDEVRSASPTSPPLPTSSIPPPIPDGHHHQKENVSSPPLQSSPTFAIAITIITPIIQDWGGSYRKSIRRKSKRKSTRRKSTRRKSTRESQLEENQQGEKELKKRNIYYLI